MIIFTDFDGTITKIDTLNMVLDKFASKNWREIEDRVTAGKLEEKKALQAEFDLVNVPLKNVLKYIKEYVEIDLTFLDFAKWCTNKNINLIVLSGGFSEFIKIVFSKFGITDIPFYSNSINVKNSKWTVIPSPIKKIKNLCNHCKTQHLTQAKKSGCKIVYIGDGNTDRCPAENADIIFAKDSLRLHMQKLEKEYYSFENFKSVQQQLQLINENKL